MRELNPKELTAVSGSKIKLRINIGTFVGGAVLGFITGGPIGLGYAVGAALMAQGINSLDDMYSNGAPY